MLSDSDMSVDPGHDYGRCLLKPRHEKADFIILRFGMGEEGISGSIVTMYKDGEDLAAYKQYMEGLMQGRQQVIAIRMASVEEIRQCHIPGRIGIDVILTHSDFPYHAEIRFAALDSTPLSMGNTPSAALSSAFSRLDRLLAQRHHPL